MTLTRSKVKVKVTGAFELPTTSEAVHAGGDDRSPLAGLSGCTSASLSKKTYYFPVTFFVRFQRPRRFCAQSYMIPSVARQT